MALFGRWIDRFGDRDGDGYFGYRLPEVFAGYLREATNFPVEYPTACSPQARATGAPLLLARVLLGLEPGGDELSVDPCLPDRIGYLELTGIPGRWGRPDAIAEGAAVST